MKRLKLIGTVLGLLSVLAIPTEAFATGFIRNSLLVARVRVADVVQVQRVVVQRQVVVQQVVAQKFVAAAIVQPVVAVQAVQAYSHGYGVQQFVQPVYAPQQYSLPPSDALRIEQERTKQEQLRTEQIRLQLTAPK